MDFKNVMMGLGIAGYLASGLASAKSPEFVERGKDAVQRGITWLKTSQNKDGSWTNIPFPAITGLAALAMMEHGLTEADPVVAKSVKWILGRVKPDGGIYEKAAASQNTAICLMALHRTGNPEYAPIVQKARSFLLSLQVDEGEGKGPEDPQFGGIGYDSKGIADLQNLYWALSALRMTAPESGPESGPTGNPETANVWDRAIVFLQRCQNLKGVNDQPWALNDGGFIYAPTPESKVEKSATQSYGTMTYAGLLSFIHCRVSKDDRRVQAAFRWIQQHYTVEENPMMGAQGLYYGYHTMAKALAAIGEDTLTDAKGIRHEWRRELTEKLVSLQYQDGYWVNSASSRWLEDNKVLVTCYALLALHHALSFSQD